MRFHTVVAAIAALATAGSASAADRFAVSDERGDAVMIFDAASWKVERRIDVGKRPRGIAVSPDGTRLLVALSGSPIGGPGVDESKLPPPDRRADGIGVVELASGKVLRKLKVGTSPWGVVRLPAAK
jgi:DNA-binding beta-propeller fold protein YncE